MPGRAGLRGKKMSESMKKTKVKSLAEVAAATGRYSPEAFAFVRDGLSFTVGRLHPGVALEEESRRHVTGRELSLGLRDFAITRYGLLARAVLNHWNIQRTQDFGKIVFAMLDYSLLRKTAEDDIRHFDDVFDFSEAFDPPQRPQPPSDPIFKL